MMWNTHKKKKIIEDKTGSPTSATKATPVDTLPTDFRSGLACFLHVCPLIILPKRQFKLPCQFSP